MEVSKWKIVQPQSPLLQYLKVVAFWTALFFMPFLLSWRLLYSVSSSLTNSTLSALRLLRSWEGTPRTPQPPTRLTVFEIESKCRVWLFGIFHQLLTCLVTLFGRKLKFFKSSPNWRVLELLMNFCQKINETFFDFQTPCLLVDVKITLASVLKWMDS